MKKHISLITLVALIFGILAGIFLPEIVSKITFIGNLYVTILKYMIVPVVFTSISVSIYDSKGKKDGLVWKSVLTFTVMFIVTFLLSSAIVILINPAKGFSFVKVEKEVNTIEITFLSMLKNLIPTDLASFAKGGKLFTVIIVSYLVGQICSTNKPGEKVMNVIKKIRDILFKILEILTYVTPLAAFSLISNTIVTYGTEAIVVALKYVLTAYICGIVTMFVVMILPVWLFAKINPITYIKKVCRIWMMTVTTRSSAATLPYTMKVCNEQFDIPSSITDVVVPLGCTIHMCGGAISFSLLGLFCASLFNVEVTFGMYLVMIGSSLIINMSAPGIPGGGVVIGATYLQLLGIPLDFIGFYSGIYYILDMLYTTMNVTGDITANILINYSLKNKEEKTHEISK